MARNAEKAMTALARWRRMKEEEERGPIARRPHDVKDCRSLSDAERFRREIIRECSKKITAIQNPGLGEFKLRDLNDEINRLIKLKHAWEQRVRELGGTDYRDDEDGRLIPLEKLVEEKDIEKISKEFAEKQAQKQKYATEATPESIYKLEEEDDDGLDTQDSVVIGEDGRPMTIRHVLLPTQQDIEEMLLEQKKKNGLHISTQSLLHKLNKIPAWCIILCVLFALITSSHSLPQTTTVQPLTWMRYFESLWDLFWSPNPLWGELRGPRATVILAAIGTMATTLVYGRLHGFTDERLSALVGSLVLFLHGCSRTETHFLIFVSIIVLYHSIYFINVYVPASNRNSTNKKN